MHMTGGPPDPEGLIGIEGTGELLYVHYVIHYGS